MSNLATNTREKKSRAFSSSGLSSTTSSAPTGSKRRTTIMSLRSKVAGGALLLSAMSSEVSGQSFTFQMGGGGGGMGDILGALMGGQMPGQQRQMQLEWPGGVTQKVDSSFEWLVNTEWQGKAGSYVFNRDGELGGTVKACAKHEGLCKWSASKTHVFLNTPDTQKTPEQVLKLVVKGTAAYESKDADAKAKLDAHQEDELKKTRLETTKPSKSTGKPSVITFSKIAASGEEDSLLAEDAFAVLEVSTEASPSEIKKSYRKKSVTHHPDKGGDPALFEKIRQAYEILSDPEKKDYYLAGGALLVKNTETFMKEMEGQVAQQMAQLDQQIPKNHPMRAQAEAQIKQQQPNKAQIKQQVEQRLRQEDTQVDVPVTLEELFAGTDSKTYTFPRLTICRGCRANPSSEECKSCGRCPPEVRQVPKMQGPFMVGSKTVEVESRERCREEPVRIPNLRVSANAADGTKMRSIRNMSHQTPGRLPGAVRFVVKRMPHETYFAQEDDLHTVLTISVEQALYGFEASWKLLNDPDAVFISREGKTTQPGEIIRVKGKGMFNAYGARGDLVVRVNVEFPTDAAKVGATITKPSAEALVIGNPRLSAEPDLLKHEGKLYRAWVESTGNGKKKKKKSSRQEL